MIARALAALLAAFACAVAAPARAAWPDKPITLIVPFAPGGMGTIFGNLVSDMLSPELGQRVVVDYRPGAAGAIGAGMVARAAPISTRRCTTTWPGGSASSPRPA